MCNATPEFLDYLQWHSTSLAHKLVISSILCIQQVVNFQWSSWNQPNVTRPSPLGGEPGHETTNNQGNENVTICVLCLPNSSTVDLASFGRASADFPLSHFRHPPNMVTCVHSGSKLMAVAVCHTWGCAPLGKGSWEGCIDKLCDNLFIVVHLWHHNVGWYTYYKQWCAHAPYCMQIQTVKPFIHHDTPLSILET